MKNCTSSIASSKNFAKVLRFGNEEQKIFVTGAEKSIQDRIVIIEKETKEISAQKVDLTTANQTIESDQQEAESDEMEEYYIV